MFLPPLTCLVLPRSTSAVRAAGSGGGDVADIRQLPVPAANAPRANLGGISDLLAILDIDSRKSSMCTSTASK